MAGLHFDITGDNSNLMDKLRQTENGIRQTSRSIEQSGVGIEQMFSRITTAAAGLGAAFAAQQFASQVMKVRGEFQQLEVAFETMLGSAEKANTLMAQLTRTAAITPFGLQDVAGGAKQLLAYGVSAENVNDTLIRLGDIAAGLSIPLNDLVYLYGTTMTQGRMFTQDLRQFQGRGIPLADELAKQFGVTKDKVGELVTAGKVGFDEMHKAIVSMTSDGGKFGGLMEAQSKTITGQISNIEDAIDGMFNQIGQSSEGVINAALGGVSKLVENWEKVAEAIGYAVTAYGSYKAVVMTMAAMDNIKMNVAAGQEIEGYRQLLAVKEQNKNADLQAAVASGSLTQAKASEIAAIREEIRERLALLQAKKAEAAAEADTALKQFEIAKQEKEAADEKLENMFALMEAAEEQGDASYIQYAQEQLQTASANANTAATRLNTAERNLNTASSRAKATAEAADTFAINVNTVANNANTTSMNFMKAAALQLQAVLKGLWATLMANPLAVVVGGLSLLAYTIYKVATAETAAEKAARKHREEQEKQLDLYKEKQSKIQSLLNVIRDETETEFEKVRAYKELGQLSPQLVNAYSREEIVTMELTDATKLLNKERDKAHYDDLQREVAAYTAKLKTLKSQLEKMSKDGSAATNQAGFFMLSRSIEDTEAYLNELQNELRQIDRLKKEAEEQSKPVEVKLVEAKANREQILQEFNAAKLALEEAQRNLANSPFATIPFAIQLRFDNAQNNLKQADTTIATLEEASKTTDNSYKTAYKNAEADWKAKKKALEDAKKKNVADYEKAKTEYDEAKKKFEGLGGDTSGKTQKQEDKADEEAQKRAEELLNIRRQNQQEEINLMKEGSAKKIAQINLDYQNELDAIRKQEKEWKKAQDGKLTNEQEEALNKQGSIAAQTREKELADLKKANLKDELQAMHDYLQEYGTIQQQKYAIAKAYDMKIAEESNATRKMMLEKEKETRIASLGAENIAMQIDWSAAFEGVGAVLGDIATETLQKVEEYMKTAEFKNLSAENKKAYSDLRGKLKSEAGGSSSPFDFKQWDVIAEQVKQYQDSVKNLLNAESQHEIAVNNLKKAQENLANATDETAKEVAQAAVDVAQGVADATGKNLKNAENKKNETKGNLQDSTDKAAKGLQNFSTALNTMASGSLYGFANGVTQLIQTISGSAAEGLSGLGKAGGIVGAILKILEALGDNPEQFIEDLLKNVADAVSQVIADLPEIVLSVLEGVVDIVGGVLGSIGSWFGIDSVGESDSALREDTERLTAVNEELIRAIENLSEEMKDATMVESTEMYEKQKDYLNTSMKNTQELMERSAKAYSKGFLGIGKTRSSGYHVDKAMKYLEAVNTPHGLEIKLTDHWKELSDIVGFSITSAEDFFNLTAEQMYQVATKAPEYYAIIKEAADNGHKDASQYMDEYLEYYEQLQELEKEYKEKLTHTSFDSIKDDFKSLLMDMESDAEDFAESFEEIMKEAIVESFILRNYKTRLQQFYDNFAKAMESDGNIDEDEQDVLRAEWEGYAKDAIEERDALFKMMGWDSSSYSQEASSKGFQTMSQDTGDELNGRFTALQISNEEIKNQMIQSVELMNQMVVVSSQGNVVLNDILQQQALANIHLADIVKYTKATSALGEKLDSIIENTKNL